MQAIIIALIFVLTHCSIFSTVGALDTTFGTSGSVTTAIQTSTLANSNTACAVQPDGKIVVVGNGNPGFAVARYTANGVLDTTFNSSGPTPGTIVTTAIGSSASANAVAIDTAGNIVVCGSATNSGVQQFAVARYTSAGVLDTTFNSTGYVTTTLSDGSFQVAYGIAINSAGKIIICGTATVASISKMVVVQYTSAGVLDTSFNTNGIRTLYFTGGSNQILYGITVKNSGQIVTCGTATLSGGLTLSIVIQCTSTGTLDTSFNSAGYAIVTNSPSLLTAYGVSCDSSGKILICISQNANYFILLRYNANGSWDTTFNGVGYVFTSIGSLVIPYGVCVDSTGRILVEGAAVISSSNYLFVAQYTSAGVLDTTTFNPSTGYNTLSMTAAPGSTGFALQSNNNIVLAGTGSGSFTTTRFLGNIPVGTIDTSFGTSGALSLAASPASLSAGQAKVMKVLSNNKILVAIDTGADTVLGQLTSAYALDTTFGSGTGMITLSGLATVKNIMTDPSGNMYVIGDNADGTASIIKKITSTGSAVTWTASTNITLSDCVQLQASGRVLVAGYDSSYNGGAGSGVIIAYNQATGALDTSFNPSATAPGAPGYYYTGVTNQIPSLSVCTSASAADKIMITYENSSSQAVAARLLANGTALDSTFSFGTGIASVSASDQIKMQIDVNGKVVVVARTSTGFVASRYTAAGANDVINVSIPLTNPSTAILKNIICLSDGSTLIVGMNTNGNTVIVASLTSAFALDTNFNYSGTTQGVLQTAVSPMVEFYGIDVTSDQGILVCGDNNATTASANPYMTRIVNNTVVTKVSQSASSTPGAGLLDATCNPSGSTPGFINFASSQLNSSSASQFPSSTIIRSCLQQSNGTYFVGGYTSSDSYVTLMSDDDVQNTAFGTSGLLTITGKTSLFAMLLAQSGALLVVGGAGSSGSNAGWLQSYDATTGVATPGFAVSSTLDAHYAIAQQSNGRILVAGTQAGVATIIAYNSTTGAVDTSFGMNGYYTATGYGRINSMLVDSSDLIYCIANNSSTNVATVICVQPSGSISNWTTALSSMTNTIGSITRCAFNQAGNIVVAGVNANSGNPTIVVNTITPGAGGGTQGTALTLAVGATGITAPYIMSLLVDLNTSPGKVIVIGYDNNTTPNTPFIIRINAAMTALDTTFNTTGVQLYNTLTSGVTTNWYTGMINKNGKITVAGYASVLTTPYLMRVYGDEFIGQYYPSLTSLSAGSAGTIDTNFATSGKLALASFGSGALAGASPKVVIPTSTGQYYIALDSPVSTVTNVIRLTNGLSLDTTFHSTGFATSITPGVTDMILDGAGKLVVIGNDPSLPYGWITRYATSGTLDTTFNGGGIASFDPVVLVNAVVEQTLGRYVLAGTLSGISGKGGLVAVTNSGAIDTTFNSGGSNPGYYDIGIANGVYALLADQFDRLIIAYKNGSGIDVVRLTSAGQIDTSFNSTGTVTAALTGADDATQVRLTFDAAGNIIVAAHTTSGISVRGLTSTGGSLYAQLNIATVITNTPVLTDLIGVSDGKVLLSGSQSGSNLMWVARLTVAGVLDTTFGAANGIMTFNFDSAGTVTGRSCTCIAIYPDGQIALVGTETNSATTPTVTPFLSMAYNNPYTTQVNICQDAQSAGTNDMTLGASSISATNLGLTFFASTAGDATSAQVARAIALQDDANILVAVDGGLSSGSATPSDIYLKMFDIDGVPQTAFGTSGQQTVLTAYQNQHVQDMITFTTIAGVHKALLAGYVTNSILGITSSLLLQYNLDSHALDTTFGGYDGNPMGIACGDAQQFNILGQQSTGRIITSGTSQSAAGVIAGYTATGKLDASFGSNGYFYQPNTTGLYTHAIDTQNRIIIGWMDSSHQVNVSRILADGSGFDTSFNSTGTINTGQTTYGNAGIQVACDASNNIFVGRVNASNTTVTIYSYTTSGSTLYTAITPALSLTNFSLTDLLIDQSGLVNIVGCDTGAGKIVIARLLANLSGLDTSFNPSGTIPGCLKYAIAAGLSQAVTDAIIHSDGRLLLVGSYN